MQTEISRSMRNPIISISIFLLTEPHLGQRWNVVVKILKFIYIYILFDIDQVNKNHTEKYHKEENTVIYNT